MRSWTKVAIIPLIYTQHNILGIIGRQRRVKVREDDSKDVARRNFLGTCTAPPIATSRAGVITGDWRPLIVQLQESSTRHLSLLRSCLMRIPIRLLNLPLFVRVNSNPSWFIGPFPTVLLLLLLRLLLLEVDLCWSYGKYFIEVKYSRKGHRCICDIILSMTSRTIL